jgi:hypothetical protein
MNKYKLTAILFSVVGTFLMGWLAITTIDNEAIEMYGIFVWVISALFIILYNMGVYSAYRNTKDDLPK